MKTLKELSEHLRQRRRAMGLNQQDMLMRIGMSQQQYQRIESGGDLRVTTLLRILDGMGLEFLLVPREERQAVERYLTGGGWADAPEVDNTEESSWAGVWRNSEDDEP